MRRWRFLAVAAVLGALPLMAADKDKPEDVEALINQGLKAYKEGKSADAIVALQAAIGAIQKAQQQGMTKFLPAAPEGWDAGEIESTSGAYTGGKDASAFTNLSRKYTRKDQKDLAVTVSMLSTKEMVEAQRTVADAYRKNPEILKAMQAAGTKMTLIDQDGWTGWSAVQKDDAQTLVFCKSCMLQVQVSKGDEKALDTFFKAIDLKGLAGALPAPAAPAK